MDNVSISLHLSQKREVEAQTQILFANPADKEEILCGLTPEEFEERFHIRLVFRSEIELGKMILTNQGMLNPEPPMFDESRRMIYDS